MGLGLTALYKLLYGVWSRISITGLLVMIRDKDLLIKVSAATIFSETLFQIYNILQVETVEGFRSGMYLVGQSMISTFVGSLNRIAAGMGEVQTAVASPGWESLWVGPSGLWMIFSGFMTLYILSKVLPVVTRKITGGDPDIVHRVLYWSVFLLAVLLYNGWADIQAFLDSAGSLTDTLAQARGDRGVNDTLNQSVNSSS